MEADLRTAVQARRAGRTYREAAQESGISTGTLSRLERGYRPSGATLMKLSTWLMQDPLRDDPRPSEIVYLEWMQDISKRLGRVQAEFAAFVHAIAQREAT